MNQKELNEILDKHKKWLFSEEGGIRADLSGEDLRCADLNVAKNTDKCHWSIMTAFFPLQCPESGSFIGWKIANGYIVKLRITENAKRSSATSRKCRCSEAEVLAIENKDGSNSGISFTRSSYDVDFVYRIGETVRVDNFDENRWNECAPGIHFFITREEAIKYGK